MKLASNVPVPYFSYPTATPARRAVTVRRPRTSLLEESDELARKQEAVCAAILGLSFVSTVVLCLWQFATA